MLLIDEMSSSDSTDSEEALQFSDQEFAEDREQLAAEVTLACIVALHYHHNKHIVAITRR